MECFEASCYTLQLDVVLNYDEAQEYCRNIGADLVTIETADEQEYLMTMISDNLAGILTYNISHFSAGTVFMRPKLTSVDVRL